MDESIKTKNPEVEKALEEVKEEVHKAEATETAESAKPDTSGVKLRDVLSDYFINRRQRIKKELLESLKETYLREPVDVDPYGSYKPGVFTYGAFWVFVEYDAESHLWQLQILPGEKGQPVGEHVVRQVRDKFIPDYAWMSRMYPPRGERSESGVILYQMPVAAQGSGGGSEE